MDRLDDEGTDPMVRLWPQRRDRPPKATVWETLVTFSGIADRAVELQFDADAVICACAQPGETPTSVAKEAYRVASEYNRLVSWTLDSPAAGSTENLRSELITLLQYHLIMVHHAVRFAFPKYRTEKSEQLRLGMTGLGAMAAELRATREHIDMLRRQSE
jgi:hypothetical protein